MGNRHLNAEEIRSMEVVLPFLRPLCAATDRCVPFASLALSFFILFSPSVQENSTTLLDLYNIQVALTAHIEGHLGDFGKFGKGVNHE